jgi:hypothetical protein
MADLRRELYGDAQISDNFSRLRIW